MSHRASYPRPPTTPPPWRTDLRSQKQKVQRKLEFGANVFIDSIEDSARDTIRKIEEIAKDLICYKGNPIDLVEELQDATAEFRDGIDDITAGFDNELREARSVLDE